MPVSSPALLGIDLGTSSVKVALIDEAGQLLSSATAAYSVDALHPGWSETDPSAWWAAVASAVRSACADSSQHRIAGVGLSGQMHGLVAADEVGGALRPAMLWSDSRAVNQLPAYSLLAPDLLARLANPLSPGMAGPMWLWLREREPATVGAMRWAMQPKDWLRARLTGAVAAEPSDASATLLYDVVADSWATDVVTDLGLDLSLLPPLLASSSAVAGALLPAVADELGLPADIPVAAGGADTAVAALGSGLVSPGDGQLTIGTGAQIVVPVPAPALPLAAAPVTHLYRAATDGEWYAMGAVVGGGLTLDWVRRLLGASWPELYAAAGAPDLDDPIFLPHLSGERTPYLDPAMRGAWIGLTTRHDRAALMRSALEGVALSVRDALDALRGATGLPLEVWRLAGGGSVAPAWRQMIADVLQVQLAVVDVPAASSRGAALLAGRAAGWWDEPSMLALLPPAPAPSVFPATNSADLASARHARFRHVVAALRPLGAH